MLARFCSPISFFLVVFCFQLLKSSICYISLQVFSEMIIIDYASNFGSILMTALFSEDEVGVVNNACR